MHKYGFNVAWSDEDQVYIATCPSFPGLSAFGDTPAEALKEAEIVLQSFIEIFEKQGKALPAPDIIPEYSGQLRVRLGPVLHGKLARLAELQGLSLNQLIVSLLSEGVGAAGVVTQMLGRLNALATFVRNDVVHGVRAMARYQVASYTDERERRYGVQDEELQRIFSEHESETASFSVELDD